MNQELIDMAKQAGFFVKDNEAYSPSVQEDHELTPFLEAFAVLVAEYSYKKGSVEASVDFEAIILPAALAKVAAAEREACAKVCEEPWQGSPKGIAESIRARGETE
jgi:hypothetical protein